MALPRIPEFTPEHFILVRNRYAGKYKQFRRGLRQLAEEGVVKVLERPHTGLQEPILGAVGPLQFQVAEHRMEHEFGAPLNVTVAPWTEAHPVEEPYVTRLAGARGTEIMRDANGRAFALFESRFWMEKAYEAVSRVQTTRLGPEGAGQGHRG